MATSCRIAVVSPVLDKRQGTERCVAEQTERLARDHGYEVHLYSQRVEDLSLDGGRIIWHRVPSAPGPGLVKYLWWFAANHLWRWWDSRVRGIRYDLVYSPGINCLDADAVAVHIVFAEFRERVRGDLALRRNPPATWPRVLHRKLYYALIVALERWIYPRRDLALAAVSHKTAHELARFYGRDGDVQVVYNAVSAQRFSPFVRERLRSSARKELELPEDAFGLLLVGNDWKKKGLPALLEAAQHVGHPRLRVLVVGRDDRALFDGQVRSLGLEGQVFFLPPRPDVEIYYAAGDVYVGPSVEDAFALPPAEAMACGLPVIVSSQAGVSEIVSDGVDGLILKDPRDAKELAGLIRSLIEDADLRHRLGEQAVQTLQKYTWERNAAETAAFLEAAMRRRGQL
jgi:UDP-glucose:(heptosyl)LPS alpha-1,3-glucosyltransferase